MTTSRTTQAVTANDPTSTRTATTRTFVLGALAAVALGAVLLRLSSGSETGGSGFSWPQGSIVKAVYEPLLGITPEPRTTMHLRMMRVLLAALAGAALAGSGVALQSLLRNPLAEPFILGLSSGAAVGLIAQLGMQKAGHIPVMPPHLGALAGSIATMAIVFFASRRGGLIDPLGMLLVGVVLGTINGAVVMLASYLSGPVGFGIGAEVSRWMMGSLNEGIDAHGWALPVAALLVVITTAVLLAFSKAMDVGTFSDAEARAMGVNLARLRLVLFIAAGVLAATAVVLAGPIAFVGLIAPHLVRLLVGPSHAPLLTGSILVGAAIVILADTATIQAQFGVGRLPIGIFTAMLGGPLFLWMLRPHMGRDAM